MDVEDSKDSVKPTIYDLAYDFNSQRFAVSSADRRISVFTKGKRKYEKMAEIKLDVRARRVTWAPPQFGQVFAAATLHDKTVRIYEESVSPDGGFKLVAQINNVATPTDLAFKPGAEPSLQLTLAVPSADGKVRIYEASDAMSLKEWKKSSELDAGSTPCTGLSWNPNYFEIPSLLVLLICLLYSYIVTYQSTRLPVERSLQYGSFTRASIDGSSLANSPITLQPLTK